jgi:hypothetical protein
MSVPIRVRGSLRFIKSFQKARHSTLLHSASTPESQAALPAACRNRRKLIPLGHCSTDLDSGRGTGQRKFYPEDASFRRAPYPACRMAGKLRFT